MTINVISKNSSVSPPPSLSDLHFFPFLHFLPSASPLFTLLYAALNPVIVPPVVETEYDEEGEKKMRRWIGNETIGEGAVERAVEGEGEGGGGGETEEFLDMTFIVMPTLHVTLFLPYQNDISLFHRNPFMSHNKY